MLSIRWCWKSVQYINEHLIIDQCIYIPGSGLIDSVVVDVGTGSGILAIWSAQASARTMVRFSLDAICRSRIHVLYHAVLPSHAMAII